MSKRTPRRPAACGRAVALILVLACAAGTFTACGAGATTGALVGAAIGASIGSAYDDPYYYDGYYYYDDYYYKPYAQSDDPVAYDDTW